MLLEAEGPETGLRVFKDLLLVVSEFGDGRGGKISLTMVSLRRTVLVVDATRIGDS